MRKLLVLALLIVPMARADSIVEATVGITPIGDPLSRDWGRVAVSYNQGTPDFNASVFNVSGRNPFTYLRAYNTLTFVPGTYDFLGFETLTISPIGRRMNFLFEIFSFPDLSMDYPGQILMFDWKLPQTVTPVLNSAGIEGDRFYIDDVALRIGTRPFESPTQNAAAFAQSDPVSTPEPATLVLLLAGLLFLVWRRP